MKTKYTVTLAMLSGIAIGAVAVHSLHAQTKPPVYIVTEINVTNPEAYGRDYSPRLRPALKLLGVVL